MSNNAEKKMRTNPGDIIFENLAVTRFLLFFLVINPR